MADTQGSFDPFKDINCDVLVIVGQLIDDEKIENLLASPAFSAPTEVVALCIDPVMLGSLLRTQRFIDEYQTRHPNARVVVAYLVDARIYGQDEIINEHLVELKKRNEDRRICITRNPEEKQVQAPCYPACAIGVIVVDSSMSSASIVALALCCMEKWQENDFYSARALCWSKEVLDILKKI